MIRFTIGCYLVMALVSFGNAKATGNQPDGVNRLLLYAISIDTPVIDNGYVRVYKDTATCTAPDNVLFEKRVIVALERMTISSSRGSISLDRGNVAVFLDQDTYNIKNAQFFEILFRRNHPPLKKPEQWMEPLKNTMVYEDARIRVFEERLAAGDDREVHSHAQRVVVRLNEVQLTDPRFYPTGQPGAGIQVPNTVRFAEPVVHVVRNLSKIPLFNIVLEFKIPN